jgi:hypothetical protein
MRRHTFMHEAAYCLQECYAFVCQQQVGHVRQGAASSATIIVYVGVLLQT